MFDWLGKGIAEGIGGIIVKALRTLCFWLDKAIYELIPQLYSLFDKLCGARLLDGTIMRMIAERVGLLLGLVMLFYVTFNFIKMMIEPDSFEDKEKGAASIIKRVLIVIVLLGVSNFAFDLLYGIQKEVIENNVISKLILPFTIENESDFGKVLSGKLMESFYEIRDFEEGEINSSGDISNYNDCKEIYELFKYNIYNYGDLELGNTCLNETVKTEVSNENEEQSVFIVKFDEIVSVAVGGFVLYFLFSYCVTVGVRMIQLACLEIMAPMAIIGYLSPKKDNMFSKWLKKYFATYIDVFIRMAIISFALFLIATIFNTSVNQGFIFWESVGVNQNSEGASLFFIMLVLAILAFAKKAPELIKDLLPVSASKLGYGGIGFKDLAGGNLIKKGLTTGIRIATGVVGGAVAGATMGALGGRSFGAFAGGLLKGGLGGLRGQGLVKSTTGAWHAQKATNKRINDWRAAGGTSTLARWKAGLQQAVGLDTEAADFDRRKGELEKENAAYKSFDSYIAAAEKRAESQILKGAFKNEHATEALKQKNLAEIYRQQSSNIKRSDFKNSENYLNKAASLYGINKNDYANDESYKEAIRTAIQENDYSFDKFVDEEYSAALENLANKASAADSLYLTEMKKAKSDFITYTLDVANGKIDGVAPDKADAPTLQSLQQAAGIVAANEANNYQGFSGVSYNSLLSGKYSTFDDANSASKQAQASNNNELARNEQEGQSARADAQHSGGHRH